MPGSIRPGVRLLSGIDGAPVFSVRDGMDKLARQVTQTVEWAACMASGNGSNEPLGHATILPLLRLGLLSVGLEPNRRLVVSEVGRATWRRFLDRGGQFPEDLTTPPGHGAAP